MKTWIVGAVVSVIVAWSWRVCETEMVVTLCYRRVRSWNLSSEKLVRPSRGPSLEILSQKTIKNCYAMFLTLKKYSIWFDLVTFFYLKKTYRDCIFFFFFFFFFLGSKSYLVLTPFSFSFWEKNELKPKKKLPKFWFCLYRTRPVGITVGFFFPVASFYCAS